MLTTAAATRWATIRRADHNRIGDAVKRIGGVEIAALGFLAVARSRVSAVGGSGFVIAFDAIIKYCF